MKLDHDKIQNSRVILLSKGEEAIRNNALHELIQNPEHNEFDIESFAADSKPQSEWIALASTHPFMGKKRLVVVRNLLREAEPKEFLKKQAKSLPEFSLIVLVADEEKGNDSKQKKFATHRTKWEKWVKSVGGYTVKFELNDRQIRMLIKEEVESKNKKISTAAIQKMIELTNSDYSLIAKEIEKIALYIGEKEEFRIHDIETLVTPSYEWNIFRLVDSSLQGKCSESLDQLRNLVKTGDKLDEAAYMKILPMISRQVKLLWQAKLHIQNNSPTADFYLEKPDFRKEQDWLQQKLIHQAKNITFDQLSQTLYLIAETDAKLKGIIHTSNILEALEQLILGMNKNIQIQK